ncbi:MAG: glutamate-5-semialdehyde dehydrogenase [bacterium]
MDYKQDLIEKAKRGKEAAKLLANVTNDVKNRALYAMAEAIEKQRDEIMAANQIDIKAAEQAKLSPALVDRLLLNDKRLRGMIEGLREVATLGDPVGEIIEEKARPNGLLIRKVRVPLGLIGIIYESRPNVTGDAAGLCIKSGNAVLLRGGSEAINSNKAIAKVLSEVAVKEGLPEGTIQFIDTTDRKAVMEMIKLNDFIDVIIPRGGEEMIKEIIANATVPVISHGKGVCHTYVDERADLRMAEGICFNAKVQRPGVCNAMETLLVHKNIAGPFLPFMIKKYQDTKVEIRGDAKTKALVKDIKEATEADWSTEYLDLILSVKVVESVEEAIEHITKYGSAHSDAIVTEDKKIAEKFLKEVDSAAVYWNASTRFTDGGEFGLGAEIGISTQKIHARGPMGVRELTSFKFKIYGNGQIRE